MLNTSIIREQTMLAVEEILNSAKFGKGNIFIVGGSTSEVKGIKIGTSSSYKIAEIILASICDICDRQMISVVVQCCEHLNRALVVERKLKEKLNLTEVSVVPTSTAGGALAEAAMNKFFEPIVVEKIKAHIGLDIGCTLIGMHIQKVAVPISLTNKYIGHALLTAARTRPPLIGGIRAKYI